MGELFPGAKECVGCGYCCIKATCSAGQRLYGETRPCPALRWDEVENRHFCKLCEFGGILGETYREELAVGAGCCMSLFNEWRENLQDRTKVVLEDSLVNPLPSIFQMFLKCLGAERMLSPDLMSFVFSRFVMELQLDGRDEKTAKVVARWAYRCMHQNHDGSMDSFMGKMKEDIF